MNDECHDAFHRPARGDQQLPNPEPSRSGSAPKIPVRSAFRPSGRRPLYEIVGATLADHIRSGALPVGTVLREKSIGELFGIGRMPAASALSSLETARLVHRRPQMHGVVVGRDPLAPLVAGDGAAKITLPSDIEAQLRIRNWRTLIYPAVEKEVASCLLFGRFQIRSQALAEYFGVSRTVANELLVRLERVDLVRQESNARWYAGPLTRERIADLYEMRALLEPQALLRSASSLDIGRIRANLRKLVVADRRETRSDPVLLHELEVDLHHDTVLLCANRELRNTLHRCQLPLITTHLMMEEYLSDPEVDLMISAHRGVFDCLLEHRIDDAASTLADHIRSAMAYAPARFARLQTRETCRFSPYLDPA